MFLAMILSLLLLQEKVAGAASDLDADKQALLDFVVPHGLGWNPADPICSSWVGVTCNLERSRVVELRLSNFGLCGSVPENTTIGRLDALETLHLENNFLTGPIPSGLGLLPCLKSLNLSNNGFSGPVPPSLLERFHPTSFGGNPSLTTGGLPPPELAAIPRLSSPPSSRASRLSSTQKYEDKKKNKGKKSGPLNSLVRFWSVTPLSTFSLFGSKKQGKETKKKNKGKESGDWGDKFYLVFLVITLGFVYWVHDAMNNPV